MINKGHAKYGKIRLPKYFQGNESMNEKSRDQLLKNELIYQGLQDIK